MEVYIFQKNKRCPYLHYAFLTLGFEQYALDNLDWESLSAEPKVDIPFLYKWLDDVKQKQTFYSQNWDDSQRIMYQVSIDTLQDIINVVEPMSGESLFEVYLTRY